MTVSLGDFLQQKSMGKVGYRVSQGEEASG